jgi:hypothetical protein
MQTRIFVDKDFAYGYLIHENFSGWSCHRFNLAAEDFKQVKLRRKRFFEVTARDRETQQENKNFFETSNSYCSLSCFTPAFGNKIFPATVKFILSW